MTATQALQHAWLRRHPPAPTAPTPKRTVERLDSTKDNLRSCVDRWGDQSPTAFFIQPPAIKELEMYEQKLPSVIIPSDCRPESVVSPTSPQSPLPKKIKLQGDEEKEKPKKTRTGSKKKKSPPTSSTNLKLGDVSPVQSSPPASTNAKLSDVSPVTTGRLSEKQLQSVAPDVPQAGGKSPLDTSNSLQKAQPQNSKSENVVTSGTKVTSIAEKKKVPEIENNEDQPKLKPSATDSSKTGAEPSSDSRISGQPVVSAVKPSNSKLELVSSTQAPKSDRPVEPKSGIDINSNYINVSQSSGPIPVQRPTTSLPSPISLPTKPCPVPVSNQRTESANVSSPEKITSNPPSPPTSKPNLPVFPRVNVIPVTQEGASTVKQETSSAKTEEKSKPPKTLISNISGLKSIWGSKISANEPKHHSIVKYNRTMSSPTPNTAKSRPVVSKPQKVPEIEESEKAPKVILHRIEVEDSKSQKSQSAILPQESRVNVNITDTNIKANSRRPINEWVNDRLLNDRFNIDRRASDISSLVNSDSFYEDHVDSVGCRLAEEISRITDKFCRLNDEEKRSNDKAAIMAQERHEKITDLLNGKRRPKYRRITYLNRDVPIGSAPPPTNMTYYLTNCLTSNSVGPLWTGTGCDFLSAPGTPLGSPRSPSEGSLDADMIFQMLSEKLKADASLKNVAPPKKTGLINS